MTPYTIDFVVRILVVSVFHWTFPLWLIPMSKVMRVPEDSVLFYAVCAYSLILYAVKILISLNHRLESRSGGGIKPIKDWEDELVLITGGSSGIGYLLAETLAIRRIQCVVLDINPLKSGLNIPFYTCDVSDPAQVSKAATEIRQEFGDPTIIINNAGLVLGGGKSILSTELKHVSASMGINLGGQVNILQEFLPAMMAAKKGHVVTMASAMGLMPAPLAFAYCASKAAVVSLHETLAAELDSPNVLNCPEIKTTLVCAGLVETGMFKGVSHRLPFWTPPVQPLDLVRDIVDALETGRSRNTILKPFYVNFIPLVNMLPSWVGALARKVSGANDAMENFQGSVGSVFDVSPDTEQVDDVVPIGGGGGGASDGNGRGRKRQSKKEQ